MGHTADTDKLFEIFGDKLRTVVADDPRCLTGKLFTRPLEDRFDILFRHLLTDFPVHNEPTIAIQYAAHIVKSATQNSDN